MHSRRVLQKSEMLVEETWLGNLGGKYFSAERPSLKRNSLWGRQKRDFAGDIGRCRQNCFGNRKLAGSLKIEVKKSFLKLVTNSPDCDIG